MVSKDEKNPLYQRDIATHTEICGKHLLQFEDENNWTSPLFCLPEDFMVLIGTPLEIIQKTDWFPQQIFQQFKENVRKNFPDRVQKRIQGASPEDVFEIINEGLKSINSELTSAILNLRKGNRNIKRLWASVRPVAAGWFCEVGNTAVSMVVQTIQSVNIQRNKNSYVILPTCLKKIYLCKR